MRRFLTMLLPSVTASLYSLQDSPTTRPSLALLEGGAPIEWWAGGPAFALASAPAVRINRRGIVVYPPAARMRNLTNLYGWHSAPCNASAWALCSSDAGETFPATSPRTPENRALIQIDGWRDMSCANSEKKVLTVMGVYDVTACDIFDEGLDIIYADSKLAHRHAQIPLWKYWTMVILAIALVRSLSYNIQDLWEKNRAKPKKNQWPALAAAFVLLVLVLIDGDAAYASTADQLFFWNTAAYILIYLALHTWTEIRIWADKDESKDESKDEPRDEYEKPVYNVIVATLQLVAMFFYSTAETPYNIVLLGMLATRGW